MNPPDSNFFLQLALAALFIGNLIAVWLGIANGRRMQKREISFAETPATKKEFDQHVESSDERIRRLEDKREEDLRISAMTRRKLHEDIQDIGKQVAGLTATTTQQTGQLQTLDRKIDGMPERVITTLRNTGVIKS
jgi:ferritin-like metal-binding protein YciE